MPPRDEALSFIQRSIAFIRQLTHGEAQKGWLRSKQLLGEAEQDYQRQEAKIFNKGTTTYPEYFADRYELARLADLIYYRTKLVDLYRHRVKSLEEEAALLAGEVAKALTAKKQPKAVKRPSGRDMRIYSVIKKGLKGRLYAVGVDRARVRTPKQWRERGCPYTYPQAYDIGKPWRDEIYREKYDVKKRVEAFKNLPRFS